MGNVACFRIKRIQPDRLRSGFLQPIDVAISGVGSLLIMVANHLDAPVALLSNQSKAGNWLQVQLVGRTSERDAVGAIVEIQCQGETFSSWMTGGDGYMCSNEPLLHFGIADHQSIDQLTVRWPNGDRQTFDDVPINRRVLLIEGLGDVFSDR